MAGTWCTKEEVDEITGVEVTETQLLRAQAVIETFVDIDPASAGDHLGVRDRERLRKATAWQAAWMFEQIDFEGRTDVESLSQDGLSFKYANPDAAVLAPMTTRNVNLLSWNTDGAYGGARDCKPYTTLDEVRDAVLCDEVELPWTFEQSGL